MVQLLSCRRIKDRGGNAVVSIVLGNVCVVDESAGKSSKGIAGAGARAHCNRNVVGVRAMVQ